MQPNNRAAVALSNEHRRAAFERRAANERLGRVHRQTAVTAYVVIADPRRVQMLAEADLARLAHGARRPAGTVRVRAALGTVVVRFGTWLSGTSQPVAADQ